VSERKGGSIEIWASEWRHGARYALASYSLYGEVCWNMWLFSGE